MARFFSSQKSALIKVVEMVRRRPTAFFMNMLSFAFVFALPFTGYVVLYNLMQLEKQIDYEPKLAVYFKPEVSEQQVSDAAVLIKRLSNVERVDIVGKESALDGLKTDPDLKAALDMLQENPFPDAAFVTPTSSRPSVINALRKELSAMTNVELVELDAVWVRRLNAGINLGQSVLFAGTLLISGIVMMIALAIGRIEVLRDAEEIELANLLGGETSIIQRPYIWFGFLLGCSGAALAGAISFMGLAALQADILALASEYELNFRPQFIPIPQIFMFIGAGGLLGAVGGWAAVRSFSSK